MLGDFGRCEWFSLGIGMSVFFFWEIAGFLRLYLICFSGAKTPLLLLNVP